MADRQGSLTQWVFEVNPTAVDVTFGTGLEQVTLAPLTTPPSPSKGET